jgi:hypothetical protein
MKMGFCVSEGPYLHCYSILPWQKEFETALILRGQNSNSLKKHGRQKDDSLKMSM